MNCDACKRVAVGAVAGLAGTLALQAVRTANQKWLPRTQPPMKDDPGRLIISKARELLPLSARSRLPQTVETAGAKLLAMGYGMTFGAAYAGARPKMKRLLCEGALLGLATWAIGFLGWLPGSRLMPPVWKQSPKQVFMPIAEHALYGIATVAGYNLLRNRLEA